MDSKYIFTRAELEDVVHTILSSFNQDEDQKFMNTFPTYNGSRESTDIVTEWAIDIHNKKLESKSQINTFGL